MFHFQSEASTCKKLSKLTLLSHLAVSYTNSSTCQSSEGEDMDNFSGGEGNAVDSMSPSC